MFHRFTVSLILPGLLVALTPPAMAQDDGGAEPSASGTPLVGEDWQGQQAGADLRELDGWKKFAGIARDAGVIVEVDGNKLLRLTPEGEGSEGFGGVETSGEGLDAGGTLVLENSAAVKDRAAVIFLADRDFTKHRYDLMVSRFPDAGRTMLSVTRRTRGGTDQVAKHWFDDADFDPSTLHSYQLKVDASDASQPTVSVSVDGTERLSFTDDDPPFEAEPDVKLTYGMYTARGDADFDNFTITRP